MVGNTLATSGWALAPPGIAGVDIRLDGKSYAAKYGFARSDVAAVKPGYPDSALAGFEFRNTFTDLAPERHRVEIVANARDGTSATLARKSLVPPDAMAMWRARLDERPTLARQPFYFLMMTSGVASGGARGAVAKYKDFVSRTQRIGVAVPILYMRTTRGAANDWVFDPTFDLSRRCKDRPVADDNLTSVIDTAIAERMPVQFILNGGIWADASCEISEWDLTDHLEEDPANCQWTQNDEVFADNYLKGLPGSTESPDLARSLTYNIYATKVREYKRRNLQAAARKIAAFARTHPELFVGVALDADTYMNPFFHKGRVFDYNPGMLRQFREWLQGSGPYAGRGRKGMPDLSRHRRAKPLTLADVNAFAHARWTSWNDVQPPRHLPGLSDPVGSDEQPIWKDAWWNVWDAFRKHVVDLHYDDLSQWVNEAGVPRDRIFSAQGLIHNDLDTPAFAINVESDSAQFDSAGVSVEGAIPSNGHLGAILYGNSARNAVTMQNGRSLFATIGRMDDHWAIVEYNNTDLSKPLEPPDYVMAYRTFRDAFNYGAREVSAMAWNGWDGQSVGKPGYLPYTAWRNTPAEEAMLDFLVSHADVPLGARLWTFGAASFPSTDGWSAERGALTAEAGFVTLNPERGAVTLLSPPDQVVRPARIDRLILRFVHDAGPSDVKVSARVTANGAWRSIGAAARPDVDLNWPVEWRNARTIVERLKIELTFAHDSEPLALSRVLLYPRKVTRASP
ncbi:MAG TPA: hypothetical protein VFZ14_07460 [Burkholderiales bacterium]|nr:hypothetical protein [Burkholderiales bacterium]